METEIKRHLLARLVPLWENNYNCCKLGSPSTGKSQFTKKFPPIRFACGTGWLSAAVVRREAMVNRIIIKLINVCWVSLPFNPT
ncbi:BREX system Lon protease-like protein BrxL [Nostoc sp.]|uniref:BREX system Lon protease-like protein BrxL n=1 Tax=Nostoc sp. TaxID=1180 RepID=UPI003FA5AAF1